MPDDPSDPADGEVGGASHADLGDALRFLDGAEAAAGGPLVDELERERLTRAVADTPARARGWRPVVARRDGTVVGYGAVTLPGSPALGDVAVDRTRPDHLAVLLALLDHLAALTAGGHAAAPDAPATSSAPDIPAPETPAPDEARTAASPQVWLRRAGADELRWLEQHGVAVARRLGVLGRALPVTGAPPPPAPDVTIRGLRPGTDDAAVASLLAAAYAGTPEAGWDVAQLQERRRLAWFRPEDLLLAEDTRDGTLLGLHWLKRRDAHTGEVHNLAVHPDAQGRGIGPLLLRAGLDHLAAVGCDEVVLWVDRANPRAVALYERAGFTTRWDDVALVPPPAGRSVGTAT